LKKAAGIPLAHSERDEEEDWNMSSNRVERTGRVGVMLALAALAMVACSSDADKTKTVTQTETERQGSTVESTTKTTTETAQGEREMETRSYVGTVTRYTPGQNIEVLTAEKETHSFSLDGKDDVVSIDPRTQVGSKVRLVEERPDAGAHRITVTIAPPA
jgi:hypothetical protein